MLGPHRGRFLFVAATANAVTAICGLLTGCGATDIELLSPRSDGGSPVAPPSPEGGPSPADAGESPMVEDAGTSTCPADALLCEGFETSLAGWSFLRSEGMATATTLDSHTGAGSLELSTQSAGAYAYLAHRLTPVSSGPLYLRAFLKIPADQAVDDYDVVLLSNAAADGGVVVSFAGAATSLSNVAGSASSPGALTFPREVWVCLEVALSLSATSTATSRLDGKRDATLLTADGVPADGYSRLAIGVVKASPTQMPTRILIDDIAIASSPIGCK